ncbi:MAG: efflux RND transporter periplasmic adaptor subunit [Myxococcales bacterium]
MTRSRLLLSAGVAAAISAAAALFFLLPRAQATPPPRAAPAAPPSVQLVAASAVRSAPREEVTGGLSPAKALQLGFEVGGRLARLEVRKGAKVAEGQVIARLDPEISDAQVQQAEAAVKAAEAHAHQASDLARRNAELAKSGSVTDLAAQSSASGAAAASAQLLAARAQLAQARAARRRHDLRAPFAGVLIDAPDQVGATVTPTSTLFTLEQLDPLLLRVTVQEDVRASLRPGVRVHVESVGRGGAATDAAVIKSIIPSADAATRRVPVEITVPNPEGRFTAHTLGRAILSLGTVESALSVPSSALASAGGDHVFVLGKAGEVRRVQVQVIDRGARDVVLKAPEPLTQVIDSPAADLAEGVQVSVR